MKRGIELDIIVSDAKQTVEMFQQVFNLEVLNVQDTVNPQDTILVNMEGMSVHFLTVNKEVGFELPASTPNSPWVNVIVDDIESTCDNAVKAGFELVVPITKEPYEGLKYMVLQDTDKYQWMVYQAE